MNHVTKQTDALVLAGGINRIRLSDGYTPGYKGFISFYGKPSIQYVIDSVKAMPQVKRICITGPEREISV